MPGTFPLSDLRSEALQLLGSGRQQPPADVQLQLAQDQCQCWRPDVHSCRESDDATNGVSPGPWQGQGNVPEGGAITTVSPSWTLTRDRPLPTTVW